MARLDIDIPYARRLVQKEIHARLDASRFVVLVAHRRMGKTVLAVNQLIRRAIKDKKERGIYAYVAPFRNQAKSIAWEYLKHYTSPLPWREVNEQELTLTLPGGNRIRIFGADNPDALRGLYFDGVVLDEVAQMKREVWEEIIRPALSDRKGWAVFIGTPKGVNLFHELYTNAQKAGGEWDSLLYRVTDTDALDEQEVSRLRIEMSENAFKQEFLCDFSASADDVLITINDAIESVRREYLPAEYMSMPLVFGVDVARFGSDKSVVFPRRGLVAFQPIVLAGADNVQVAQRIISLYHEHKPHSIFVDAGQGQGVIDIINRALNCVYEIPFGGQALDPARFVNRRSEMWYRMREWIRAGGNIPDMPDLVSELSAPLYSFNATGKIQLEKKEDIKDRVGRSPDLADALALTFAMDILPEVEHRHEYAIKPQNVLGNYDAVDDYAIRPSGALGGYYGI